MSSLDGAVLYMHVECALHAAIENMLFTLVLASPSSRSNSTPADDNCLLDVDYIVVYSINGYSR